MGLMRDDDLTPPKTAEDKYRVMRQRFADCESAESTLRNQAIDDFRFIWVAGSQWDNNFGRLRGSRPKYEFNKLRQSVKQVINDMRMNTPSIKIRASEDGDVKLAEIRQGLIRNIESQSRADEAYDWGGMYAVSCGFGVWRVTTEYSNDDSFDQDIRIKRIHNPFSVRFDPSATELDRSDAQFAFVEDSVSRAEFRRRWPKAEIVAFDSSLTGDRRDWYRDKEVRIAEYWQRVPVTKEILRLSDGRVVDADDFDEEAAAIPPLDEMGQPQGEGITVEDRRPIESHKITMEIVSGEETLEGPFDWPGRYIPLVPVWGDIVHVDGKDEWYGMARMSRDAQVLYNFERSNFAEVIANQPKSPYLYTAKQIEGFEREWRDLAVDNAPGLPYNPDPLAPGLRPQREAPPQLSPGYMAALQLSSEDLKSTTGIYDASLGSRSNETSGKAIMARQREGDVANFDYQDNISRAILYTGIIVNDLIPHIYDSERQIRILGEDGSEEFLAVNKPIWDEQAQDWVTVNDLRQGKYDVSITTGPSYTTQRMETLDAMMQLAQSNGPDGMLARYGVLKAMDTPGMDEVRDAYRSLLVKQGLLQPGEGDQPPEPQQPNPKDLTDAKKNDAQAQLYGAQAQGQQLENMQLEQQLQAQQMLMGMPPPVPPPQEQAAPEQPLQGGFFMGGDPGLDPTAPAGQPGYPI
ncbi:hypothetical protein XcvCFBP7113P_16725 [Xanthomonas citri pv. vignicola]|nr:hypothetical protein XcvCFBP7113P_16725 [Xanthomonas citri pv. vignicola]